MHPLCAIYMPPAVMLLFGGTVAPVCILYVVGRRAMSDWWGSIVRSQLWQWLHNAMHIHTACICVLPPDVAAEQLRWRNCN